MRNALALLGTMTLGVLDRAFPSDVASKAAAAYVTVGRYETSE